MANEGNVGNVGSGNVGVGSTVPPDVARYQALVAAQSAGNVGNVSECGVDPAPSIVTADAGNVGVGSTSTSEDTVTADAGNVGVGSTSTGSGIGAYCK